MAPPVPTKPSRAASKGREARAGIGLEREGAHAGERQDGVQVAVLGPDDEHALLPAEDDVVVGKAEGVRRGGAGRGKAAGGALDLESRHQVEIEGARDRADDAEGRAAGDAQLHHPVVVVGRQHGRAAGSGVEPGARLGKVPFGQAGVGDRLEHRAMGEESVGRHRAQDLPLDRVPGRPFPVLLVHRVGRELLDRPDHLAGDILLLEGRVELEAVAQITQVARDRRRVIADAGDEAQSGDENSWHAGGSNMPTLRRGSTRQRTLTPGRHAPVA